MRTRNRMAGDRVPAAVRLSLIAVVMLQAGAGWLPVAAEGVDLAGAEARAQVAPGDFQAQLDLGVAYYEADRLEEAVAAFRRAIEIDSTSVPALVNLGVTLIDLDRVEEAVPVLEQALVVRPEDPATLANLGIAHYAAGRIEAAVKFLQEAIAIDPGDPLAHFHLGVAFAQARLYEEAVREWQAVIVANPEAPAAQQALKNIERIEALYSAERMRNRQEALTDQK